jgi:hypothetical protein
MLNPEYLGESTWNYPNIWNPKYDKVSRKMSRYPKFEIQKGI